MNSVVLSRTAAGKLLDRSEAGRRAPREDFDGFSSAQVPKAKDFLCPGWKSIEFSDSHDS